MFMTKITRNEPEEDPAGVRRRSPPPLSTRVSAHGGRFQARRQRKSTARPAPKWSQARQREEEASQQESESNPEDDAKQQNLDTYFRKEPIHFTVYRNVGETVVYCAGNPPLSAFQGSILMRGPPNVKPITILEAIPWLHRARRPPFCCLRFLFRKGYKNRKSL